MASYFVYSDDKYLLHESVRNHPEASNEAKRAERDLFRIYKYRDDSSTIQVGLKGYAADADDVTETGLVEAVKDAVAAIVSTRLIGYDTIDGVKSESLGEYSITYKDGGADGSDALPSCVEGYLADYDIRPAVYWY